MPNQPVTYDPKPFSERAFEFVRQFLVTMILHRRAWEFIQKYQPWQGLNRYGWIAKVIIGIAVIIGLQLFWSLYQTVAQAVNNPQAFGASVASVFTDFSFEKINWMLQGGRKYLVLILMEIVTFHFIQRTLEIQVGRKPDYSFNAFIRAEKRMIVVSLMTWVMETIVRGLADIPLGILGLSWLKQPVGLVIQFFFLGFTLIDTYHECFELKVEESRKRTWQVAGVAVAIGLVAYVLMFIPVAGVLAATMLGGVAAAMAMERFAPVTEEEVAAYKLASVAKKSKKV